MMSNSFSTFARAGDRAEPQTCGQRWSSPQPRNGLERKVRAWFLTLWLQREVHRLSELSQLTEPRLGTGQTNPE